MCQRMLVVGGAVVSRARGVEGTATTGMSSSGVLLADDRQCPA